MVLFGAVSEAQSCWGSVPLRVLREYGLADFQFTLYLTLPVEDVTSASLSGPCARLLPY